MGSKLKTGLLIGAYILYRLKGGPKLVDRLKFEAIRLLGNYISRPMEPISIKLNDTEYKIF